MSKTSITAHILLPIFLCVSPVVQSAETKNALSETLDIIEEILPDSSESEGQKESPDNSDNEVLKEEGVSPDGTETDNESVGEPSAEKSQRDLFDDEADADTQGSESSDTVDDSDKGEAQPDEDDGAVKPDGSDNTADATPSGVDTLEGVTCGGTGSCTIDSTGLPLRALPRSFSALYDNPGSGGKMISNAVSAFKPVFVFSVKDINQDDVTNIQGWYQVGFSVRRAMGWMRAKDIVEWRQALLLEYLHPGVGENKRSPVLMFDDKNALSDVVLGQNRKKDVTELLQQVAKGEVPEGVIGKEPAQYLNIDDTFYLLPVIDWTRESQLDEPSHYLQVFAAVPGARADEAGDSTLKDKNYLSEDAFLDVKDSLVDIVFVMDMTGSMQPYIDAVKSSMADMVELINESGIDPERMRFGLVGYRDSIDVTPELEWNVKNFTPELENPDTFLETLSTAEAATVSSDEWAEDVHGGYLAGVKSAWRSSPKAGEEAGRKSVRFMLLIGDASGHTLSDEIRGKKNSTGMDAATLLKEANAAGIYKYTIYLQDERAEPDWELAQEQFRNLAGTISGEGESTYSASTANAGKNIGDTVGYIGQQVVCRIKGEEEATCSTVDSAAIEPSDDAEDKDSAEMIDIANGVMRAAFADYYGDSAKPAKDFLSWVHDYDLADPYREALGVRVLITRQQFDNIVRQTENLVDTVEGVVLGNMDFYVALQTTSAKTSLGLDVSADQSLGDQDYLPKWVKSLPYKSAVLAITPSAFANLSATERKEFQAQLNSKYQAYLEISANTNRWFQLDEGDDKLQEVVALPLTSLP